MLEWDLTVESLLKCRHPGTFEVYALSYFDEMDVIHFLSYFSSAAKAKRWKEVLCAENHIFHFTDFLYDCTQSEDEPSAPEFGFWLAIVKYGECGDWARDSGGPRDDEVFTADEMTLSGVFVYNLHLSDMRVSGADNEIELGTYRTRRSAIEAGQRHFHKVNEVSGSTSLELWRERSLSGIKYLVFTSRIDPELAVQEFMKQQVRISDCCFYPEITEDVTEEVVIREDMGQATN